LLNILIQSIHQSINQSMSTNHFI